MKNAKILLKRLLRLAGFSIHRNRTIGEAESISDLPPDLDQSFVTLYNQNRDLLGPFTPKLYTTYQTTRYVITNNLQGDLIECGVYQGRHIALMALTLLELGVNNDLSPIVGPVPLREIDHIRPPPWQTQPEAGN